MSACLLRRVVFYSKLHEAWFSHYVTMLHFLFQNLRAMKTVTWTENRETLEFSRWAQYSYLLQQDIFAVCFAVLNPRRKTAHIRVFVHS